MITDDAIAKKLAELGPMPDRIRAKLAHRITEAIKADVQLTPTNSVAA